MTDPTDPTGRHRASGEPAPRYSRAGDPSDKADLGVSDAETVPVAEAMATGDEPGVGSDFVGGRAASLWSDAWRELRRNPVFLVSVLIIVAVISMALFPGLWTSADPRECHLENARQGPTDGALFGYSAQGCDYYSHVIYGAGPSIQVAVFATFGIAVIGILFGVIAGYFSGPIDTIISRLVDVTFGLPFLLGALILLALLRSRSVWAVVFVLIALGWPPVTRIMRASVLSTKHLDYVSAARSLGAGHLRIIARHIIPNAIAPAVVVLTITLGAFVAAEATLSFLGVGLRPPTVSWGVMLTEATRWVRSGDLYLLLFPCAFLVATVLAFIMLGDAVRDALDPKLR